MKDTNAELRDKLEEVRELADKQDTENARLQEELDASRAENARLQEENAGLQEELDASQAENASCKATLEQIAAAAANPVGNPEEALELEDEQDSENARSSSSSAGYSSSGEATGKIKDHYYLGPFRINYERDASKPAPQGHWRNETIGTLP